MLSVVLEYKNRSGLYKSGVQDFDRNFAEPRHVVGRIGEDDVVRSRCRLDEAENVATDQREIIGFELFGNLFDESLLRGGFLDGSHMRTLPGKELEADGPRAGEQVKGAQTFEIDDVLKNVEYIFAGEVGGGLAVILEGTSKRRLPYFPRIIRIKAGLLMGMERKEPDGRLGMPPTGK